MTTHGKQCQQPIRIHMKELPVNQAMDRIETLSRLAREIKDHYTSAVFKAKNAKGQAEEAVKEVILCGQRLALAKSKMPHGKWEKWLAANCSDISQETAQRYMRISKASHVTDLTKCTGLRQAYVVAGILPEFVPGAQKPAGPITAADLLRFAGFAAKITPESFSGMVLEEEQRTMLRERLKPAHEAYLALGDAA